MPMKLLAVFLMLALLFAGCSAGQEEYSSAETSSVVAEPEPLLDESPPEAPPAEPELPALDTIDMTYEMAFTLLEPDETGYVVIKTREELAALSHLTNHPEEASVADAVSLTKFRLGGNINMKGYDFPPIGSAENPFQGVFDGDGHIIHSLTVRDAYHPDGTGLFGAVGISGAVKNVHLVEANITGSRSTGGIAGICQGTLEGCSVNGSVFSANENVGGLAGLLLDGAKVSQCAANVSTRGGAVVGGFCGRALGNASTSDCYSLGSVVLVAGVVDSNLLGGFVGAFESGTISNCYAVTEVYSNTPVNVAGAFAGYCAGSVSSCYYESASTANWKPVSLVESENEPDITACTVEEITERDTFKQWDFASVWGITDGKNRGLPYLQVISG